MRESQKSVEAATSLEASEGTTGEVSLPIGDAPRVPGRPLLRSDARELKPRRQPVTRKTVRLHPGTLPPFDPIARLQETMRREGRIGLAVGLSGALLVHSAAAAHGFSSLLELGAFAETVRHSVAEDIRSTVAVEVNKPPPAPVKDEPPPEKPKLPAPAPAPKAPTAPPPPDEPPPAPAQAGKVLTQASDPDEPLDLTDQGFVTGESERFAGGVTASTGTSTVAVRDQNAKIGGVPGGKGTGPAVPVAPPPPKQDLSRPASPASLSWDCGWPPEADVEQIDFMRVKVVVTVGPNGEAQNVTVLGDPGYGFGRSAKQCALRKTYTPGLDANGRPTVTTTAPFVIKFTR